MAELDKGPVCSGGHSEERAQQGRQGALLEGQQVWVKPLLVKAAGPCLWRWAVVLQGLSQADGAQAEFEAVPLNGSRGGGFSALISFQLGFLLVALVY